MRVIASDCFKLGPTHFSGKSRELNLYFLEDEHIVLGELRKVRVRVTMFAKRIETFAKGGVVNTFKIGIGT